MQSGLGSCLCYPGLQCSRGNRCQVSKNIFNSQYVCTHRPKQRPLCCESVVGQSDASGAFWKLPAESRSSIAQAQAYINGPSLTGERHVAVLCVGIIVMLTLTWEDKLAPCSPPVMKSLPTSSTNPPPCLPQLPPVPLLPLLVTPASWLQWHASLPCSPWPRCGDYWCLSVPVLHDLRGTSISICVHRWSFKEAASGCCRMVLFTACYAANFLSCPPTKEQLFTVKKINKEINEIK